MTHEAELQALREADEHFRRVRKELLRDGGLTTDEAEQIDEALRCIASDARQLRAKAAKATCLAEPCACGRVHE